MRDFAEGWPGTAICIVLLLVMAYMVYKDKFTLALIPAGLSLVISIIGGDGKAILASGVLMIILVVGAFAQFMVSRIDSGDDESDDESDEDDDEDDRDVEQHINEISKPDNR